MMFAEFSAQKVKQLCNIQNNNHKLAHIRNHYNYKPKTHLS